jgi:hypothetical protein
VEKLGGVDLADDSSPNQQWTIAAVGNGQYRLTAANGLVLTAVERRSPLALRPDDGSSLQRWTFKTNGTSFNIGNIGNGENLDDNWGGARTIVYQWTADPKNPNQSWSVVRLEGTPISGAIPDGTYRITCPAGGNVALSYSEPETRIQLMDLASGTIKTLWSSFTNHPSETAYSRESGTFLMNCSSENGQSLIRFNYRTGVATAEPVMATQSWTLRPRSAWTDDSPNFASLSQDGSLESAWLSDDGLNTFSIRRKPGAAPQRLLWCGGVTAHRSLHNGHLYVVGYPTNEPPGVWDYDLATGSLDCIVSGLSQPLKQATYVAPSHGLLTNAAGATSGYSLWRPARFSARKKYPIILCQTVNGEWLPFVETAANLGCYFAVAHRPYWLSRKLQDWPADVMALYEALARNPNVDTNRVYLWGHSAETSQLSQLFAEKAQLWNGAILFDPGVLPDLPRVMHAKILIIAGQNDAQQVERLTRYQDQAAQAGTPLKLIFQENTGHNPVSTRAMRDRTRAFAKLLNDDL